MSKEEKLMKIMRLLSYASPIFFCLNFRRFLVITQIISNGFT